MGPKTGLAPGTSGISWSTLGRCGGSFSAFFSAKTSAYSAYSRGTDVGTLEGWIALIWASGELLKESMAASTAALSSVTSMTVKAMSWSRFGSMCLVGRMAGRQERRREVLSEVEVCEGENSDKGGGQGSVLGDEGIDGGSRVR